MRLRDITLALFGWTIVGAAETVVSYSREIAPIFAMRCAKCHGLRSRNPAGNLGLRNHADLLAGGNLGRAVVPGHPDKSPLLWFIDGSRGEGQRMPPGAPPLSPAQIETIRRWIAEGAIKDDHDLPQPQIRANAQPGQTLEIAVSLPVEALVSIAILAPGSEEPLHLEEAVIKSALDPTASGRTGEWIRWKLFRASDWPREITIEMTVLYANGNLAGSQLKVGEANFFHLVNEAP